MAGMGAANVQQFTHHTNPSTKNMVYRQTTHPKETHKIRPTFTSQGSAGGKWAAARATPGLKQGASKNTLKKMQKKKIGHGRRRTKALK